MSSIYNSADSRFQQKSGADESEKVRHNNNMSQPFTVNQAAAFLQISRNQIYRLFDMKLLRNYHVGRKRFVSMDAIKDFINEREEDEQ